MDLALLFEYVSQARKDEDAPVRLYQSLRGGSGGSPVQAMLWPHVAQVLIASKRYRELVATHDVALDALGRGEARIGSVEDCPRDVVELCREHFVGLYLDIGSRYFEGLAGTGNMSEAKLIADRMVERWPHANTFVALMKAAVRAEQPTLARTMGAQAAQRLSPEEYSEVAAALPPLEGPATQ